MPMGCSSATEQGAVNSKVGSLILPIPANY